VGDCSTYKDMTVLCRSGLTIGKCDIMERLCIECGREFDAKPKEKVCSDESRRARIIKQKADWGMSHTQKSRPRGYYKSPTPDQKPMKFVSHLEERMRLAKKLGITYAELQGRDILRKGELR